MGDLEALGLDQVEERVYEALAQHSRLSPGQLGRAAGVTARQARVALGALADMGLVVASTAEAGRYAVTPPEAAVSALVESRQEALSRARSRATVLAAHAARIVELEHPTELVGVAIGAESVHLHFIQMQRAAREEVLTFDRPPYPFTGGTVVGSIPVASRPPGLRFRTVYDRSVLEDPVLAARVEAELENGEIGRVLAGVPIKLAIGDRSMAMLPLTDADSPGGQSALIIRSSVLLDSLVALFESLWEKAIPLRVGGRLADAQTTDPEVVRTARLMAAGLKDAAMARQLGVTERTVRRRVAAVLDALGVDSRFQAGMRAKELGWV
jgi:DNA-binding transcriptional ArsR family regulator